MSTVPLDTGSVRRGSVAEMSGTTTARKEKCFLCHLPIQNKLYVQEIPGVDVVKNKFVCSVHLDLCTACWGPHQSVFGGRSASDKKEKDHYWAAKAFKRGVPNAAPYFYFPSDAANKDLNEKERAQRRKDEQPFFECCHPQCFCMKCNKPKIISRFIENDLKSHYCSCPGVMAQDVEPIHWDTYGSLGSSTHEEGPFALPFIFFQFMYVSLCDVTKHRTQGIKSSSTDIHLDDSWEHFLKQPKLKNVKSPNTFINFAIQDCKFFLGLKGPNADMDLEILFQYIHMLFRVGHPAWASILEDVDRLPENERTGKKVFDLIKDRKYRIPIMSVIIWHLMKEKPWGDLTGLQFSQLVNDLFTEYDQQVRDEAAKFKSNHKELSYLYRTSPQIIIQGDLGLNVFCRGLPFFATPEQQQVFQSLNCTDESVVSKASDVIDAMKKADEATQAAENVHVFAKRERNQAVTDSDTPSHYKSSFDYVRSLERCLNAKAQEGADDSTPRDEVFKSKAALTLASCQMLIDGGDTGASVVVPNDVLRATLTTDSDPEIFQQSFALKLAHAAALEDADDRFISLGQDDIDKLRRGVFAKGATSALSNLASLAFKSKFEAYLNALKEAKAQNGNQASLDNLNKAIHDLIRQIDGDASRMFVSKEGRVGMLLLTGKAMTRKRKEFPCANLEDWMLNSEYDYSCKDIDGRIYDAIAECLKNDKSMPWMISTPTFESYLDYVLENPTFDNDSDEITDIDELLARSNALFDSAANPELGQGDGDWNSRFEDRCKARNEAAMKIAPPLKISEDVADDLCERLINGSLNSEAPSTPLLNACTAVDPESVYNNPGLLKIITESEMGVKPSESNMSHLAKMKAKLAGAGGAPEKPSKRAKDIVADTAAHNPELMKMLNLANRDLIEEALAAPNFQEWLEKNRDRVNALSPLEKVAFCNEAVLKNKNVDPVRREAICKEILDGLTDEEKAALESGDKAKLLSLLPTIDYDDGENEIDEDSIVPDNINQNEAASHSVQKRYNPDEPLMEQAAKIVDDIRKRFKELRDFAKKNGVEDPEDVGLSENNEIIACRRGLEALHDLALADRGPDDPEVKALAKLANKLRALEKADKSGKTPPLCTVVVDNTGYRRVVGEEKCCELCDNRPSNGLIKLTNEGEGEPTCATLHGVPYYQQKVIQLANLVLDKQPEREKCKVSVKSEKTMPEFKFWREVQQQLQDANLTPRKASDQGKQAAKVLWRRRGSVEEGGVYEDLAPSAPLFECLQKVQVNISMACCYSAISKAHAREVLELAVMGVIAICDWSVFQDDLLVLAHTF